MAQALDDLLDSLEDRTMPPAEEAKSIAQLADPKTLDALIGACGDEYWSVRTRAGWGWRRSVAQRPSGVDCALFNDPDHGGPHERLRPVVWLGVGHLDRLTDSLGKMSGGAFGSMRRKPVAICAMRAAVDGLVFACQDQDGAVKSARRGGVGENRDAKAIPVLIKLFRVRRRLCVRDSRDRVGGHRSALSRSAARDHEG